jgi:hypothetical protein
MLGIPAQVEAKTYIEPTAAVIASADDFQTVARNYETVAIVYDNQIIPTLTPLDYGFGRAVFTATDYFDASYFHLDGVLPNIPDNPNGVNSIMTFYNKDKYVLMGDESALAEWFNSLDVNAYSYELIPSNVVYAPGKQGWIKDYSAEVEEWYNFNKLTSTSPINVVSARQNKIFDGTEAHYPKAMIHTLSTGKAEDIFLRAMEIGNETFYEVVANLDSDIQSFGFDLNSSSALKIEDFLVDEDLSSLGGVFLTNIIDENNISFALISTGNALQGSQEHILARFKTVGEGKITIAQGELGTVSVPSHFYELNSSEISGDGTFDLGINPGADVQLQVSADFITPSTNPITPSDALEVLKTVVRINQSPTHDQLIAGDVDRDGKLTPSDALSILKKVVRMEGGVEPEWIFTDRDHNYDNLSFTNVTYENVIKITDFVTTNQLNIEGVLLGDFDGTL